MTEPDEKNVAQATNGNGNDVSSSEKQVVEEEISEKLGTLLEHNEGDKKLLARLIANPMVRQILEAEETGKKLSLTDSDKGGDTESQRSISDLEAPAVDLGSSKDLEEMPRAEFAKLLLEKLGPIVGSVVKEGLSGVVDKVTALEGYVSGQEEKSVDKQIAKARKDHKDFDSYKKEMLSLYKGNPGLSVEQLFVLAKHEAGDKTPPQVTTERPDTSSSRSRSRERKPTDLALGRRGMDEMLEVALEKFDFSEIDK